MIVEPRHDPALTAHRHDRCQLFAQEKAKDEAYLFLGSSIVEFFSLKKFLGSHLPLVNHGIAGLSAHWLAQHLLEVLGNVSAKKIFVLIGTNDIGMNYSLDETFEAIETISYELRAASIASQLYLISVLPVNEANQFQARVKIRKNATIQALNERLSHLPAFEFIDAYSAMVGADGQLPLDYTTDGLHLSQAGYQALAQVIKPYVEDA